MLGAYTWVTDRHRGHKYADIFVVGVQLFSNVPHLLELLAMLDRDSCDEGSKGDTHGDSLLGIAGGQDCG